MQDEVLIKVRADIDGFEKDMQQAKSVGNKLIAEIEGQNPLSKTNENAKKLKDTLTELSKTAKGVNFSNVNIDEVSNDVNGLKKLMVQLKETQTQYTKGSEEYKALAKSIQQVGFQISNVTIENKKAAESAKKLKEEEQAATAAAKAASKAAADAAKALAEENKKATQTAGEMNSGFGEAFMSLKDGFDLFKSGDLVGAFTAIRGGIMGMTSASLAFIATPIGATIAALAGIGIATKEWFDFNIEVSKLNSQVEQLTGTTGNVTNELRKNGIAIANVFGKDFGEAVREQDQLMKQFGLTAEQAFKVYSNGLALGGAGSSEFGDSIREYGVFFKKAGFDADEFLNILNTGIDLGVYTDKLPDAIKEFGLRISEGTKPAEDALINAFGPNFTQKILGGVRNGSLSVKDSLVAISQEAQKAGLNTQQLAQLTADLGGGPAEDLGGIEALFKAINQSQELATKGLSDYEQAMIDSANKAKELEDAKDRAFKSDNAVAFAKTVSVLWSDIQIAFFNAIAELRPVFEFIVNNLKTSFEGIKATINVVSNLLKGDFKGAIEVIKGYFTSLNFTWDGVIDKMVLKISEGLLYIAKKVKPVFDALGINTDNIIKSLETSIVRSTNNIAKIQNQKKAAMDVAVAEQKATTTTRASNKNVAATEGEEKKASEAAAKALKAKKDLEKFTIEQFQKESKIKQDAFDATLSQQQLEQRAVQDKYFELIETAKQYGLDTTALEAKRVADLKAIDDKYLKEKTDTEKEQQSKAYENELKLADDLSKQQSIILKNRLANGEITEEQYNEQIKDLELSTLESKILIASKWSGTVKKAAEDITTFTNQEADKRLDKEIQNNKKREDLLKKQFNEIFEFANNGILLQIGLNPQDVNRVKGSIEDLQKTLNKKGATPEEKAAAYAEAAGAVAGTVSNALFAADTQRRQEELAALQAQQEEELRLAGDNEQKKDLIRQKYALKEKDIKRKQAEADKKKAMLDIVINTAVAVVKAFATTGPIAGPVFAAIVGALGLAQLALVAAQPIPKFEKGGAIPSSDIQGMISGKPHAAGGVLIEAEGNEFITRRSQAMKGDNLGLLEAINMSDSERDAYINRHYVMPALQAKESEAAKSYRSSIIEAENNLIAKVSSSTLKSIDRRLVETNQSIKGLAKKDYTW